MSPELKLTVCMITYNHERYIAQAVQSVLMQQAKFPIEIVIGDDCSTDRTPAILAELQARHPETIRLLSRSRNLGMNANFADTFFQCSGKYVAILEGDDFWTDPNKAQKQVDALESHPNWALCFHTAKAVFQDETQEEFLYPKDWSKAEATIEDLLNTNFIQTCSVVCRNHLLSALPPWFTTLSLGDWPFFLLHARHGNIGYLSDVMAVYRIHPGGVWSSKSVLAKHQSVYEMTCHIEREFSDDHAVLAARLAGFYAGTLAAELAKAGLHVESQARLLDAIRYYLKAEGGVVNIKSLSKMIARTLAHFAPCNDWTVLHDGLSQLTDGSPLQRRKTSLSRAIDWGVRYPFAWLK